MVSELGELLTSELHPDGRWHARYPTATRTLCGREASERSLIGQLPAPTCRLCAKTSRAFNRVGPSIPDHWQDA